MDPPIKRTILWAGTLRPLNRKSIKKRIFSGHFFAPAFYTPFFGGYLAISCILAIFYTFFPFLYVFSYIQIHPEKPPFLLIFNKFLKNTPKTPFLTISFSVFSPFYSYFIYFYISLCILIYFYIFSIQPIFTSFPP
jgi:hypothetical protein